MKINSIKNYQGQCCPHEYIKHQADQQLNCIICYQVMTKPVKLACPAGHKFGMYCLKLWTKDKSQVQCPLCRIISKTWSICPQATQKINKTMSTCIYCKQWQGPMSQFQDHKYTCQKFFQYIQQQLQKIVKEEITELDKEINPHLTSIHTQIFNKYVQNWKWLMYDLRDWKWWWWCNNQWWNNQSCDRCNTLWHKYEKKIDQLEDNRICLLKIMQKRQKIQQKNIEKKSEKQKVEKKQQ